MNTIAKCMAALCLTLTTACVDDAQVTNTNPPVVEKGKCAVDKDCPNETTCDTEGGYCLKTILMPEKIEQHCQSDADCTNAVCKSDGYCYEVNTQVVYGGCTENSQCHDGRICDQGFCVKQAITPTDGCQADWQCAIGKICKQGTCSVGPFALDERTAVQYFEAPTYPDPILAVSGNYENNVGDITITYQYDYSYEYPIKHTGIAAKTYAGHIWEVEVPVPRPNAEIPAGHVFGINVQITGRDASGHSSTVYSNTWLTSEN